MNSWLYVVLGAFLLAGFAQITFLIPCAAGQVAVQKASRVWVRQSCTFFLRLRHTNILPVAAQITVVSNRALPITACWRLLIPLNVLTMHVSFCFKCFGFFRVFCNSSLCYPTNPTTPSCHLSYSRPGSSACDYANLPRVA